jgi:hypothetical protein
MIRSNESKRRVVNSVTHMQTRVLSLVRNAKLIYLAEKQIIIEVQLFRARSAFEYTYVMITKEKERFKD